MDIAQFITKLQVEVYAFKACPAENIDRGYISRNSKLVWDCHQSLVKLDELNRVQLVSVSDNSEIDGNETTHQLAKMGSEPACGTSTGVAKKAVRD
jgi:hypothetical protein